MFKTLLSAMLFVYSVGPLTASAQITLSNNALPNPYSDLKTLNGYTPSLLASEDSALAAYKALPTDIFDRKSWCFQRGQVWTHLLDEQFGVKSMKVFLYFTRRYQEEFDYNWTYHTAPLIPTMMKDGSVQDLVFDPTFTSTPHGENSANYDDKPLPIAQWLKYFVIPGIECKVIDNYADYINNQYQYYCYIMKAPMYQYSPQDFARDITGETGSRGAAWFNSNTGVRTGWRIGDDDNSKKALNSSN